MKDAIKSLEAIIADTKSILAGYETLIKMAKNRGDNLELARLYSKLSDEYRDITWATSKLDYLKSLPTEE